MSLSLSNWHHNLQNNIKLNHTRDKNQLSIKSLVSYTTFPPYVVHFVTYRCFYYPMASCDSWSGNVPPCYAEPHLACVQWNVPPWTMNCTMCWFMVACLSSFREALRACFIVCTNHSARLLVAGWYEALRTCLKMLLFRNLWNIADTNPVGHCPWPPAM